MGVSASAAPDLRPPEPREERCKVAFVGRQRCGKTRLVFALAERDQSDYDYYMRASTIGLDFFVLTRDVGNLRLKVQLWDPPPGGERFMQYPRVFYRGADVTVVTYAQHDRESFEEVTHFANSARRNSAHVVPGVMVAVLLVATGTDRDEVVSEDEGRATADLLGARFFAVSATTGDGVAELREAIVAAAAAQLVERCAN